MAEVSERIRGLIPASMTQRELARDASMTPDALSRALSGQRGLSPIEVANIARILNVNIHWLITGEADPFEVSVAARHTWDSVRQERVNEGLADDQLALDQVVALYRGAFPGGPISSVELSTSPAEIGALLGVGFVRNFAEQVEAELEIDVLRIGGLKTDYSLQIGARSVIVLATQPSWYRSNWSLAHELGHLALGHHDSVGSQSPKRNEITADQFAANLLLPEASVARFAELDDAASAAALAWELGVSTEAIRRRLSDLRRTTNGPVASALSMSTPRLLRGHLRVDGGDPITQIVRREQGAAARRMPVRLITELTRQTDLGVISPALLAWALDVPVDELDFPDPEVRESNYGEMLADRPRAANWRELVEKTATR